MHRLNSQDSLMVYGEATGWPLLMAALQVYDPAGSPHGLDLARVRDLYRSRMPHLPAMRRRLVRTPGALDRPVWVEDPDLDVDAHVRGVRVPAPGSDRQFAELVGTLFEPPLDLTRPPWDVWVIEGLPGGKVAVLTRIHHSAADGMRGLEIQAALFDIDPEAPLERPGGTTADDEAAPGGLRLLSGAAARLVGVPFRAARTTARLAGTTARLAGVVGRGDNEGLSLPLTGPRTSLNHGVSTRRGFAFCSLPLAPVKRAAKVEGVTVNDVVLALVGGALRRYLHDRGELPDTSLVAAIPVGRAAPDLDSDAPGNWWAAMFASLATEVADPVERLQAVAASARAGKAVQQAVTPQLWQDLVSVPPVFINMLARAYVGLRLVDHHPPLANVVVSNLRGPSFPLYLAGARLVGNYPLGPIADGIGLNLTIISYLGSLDFGLSLCPDLVEDPWALVDALTAEGEELERRYPSVSEDSG